MPDPSLDKSVFSFTTPHDADAADIAYWLSRTPSERIAALEDLRRWTYGDAAIDAGLQRVFEFAQRKED